MNMHISKRPSGLTLILLTITFSLIVHAAALYTIHGSDISFYSPRIALVENQMQAIEEIEKIVSQRHHDEERSIQIASAFHALSQEERPEKIQQEHGQLEQISTQFEALAYEESQPIENANNSVNKNADKNDNALAVVLADAEDASILSMMEGEASPSLPDALQLLFENDSLLIKEITQATEGIHGDIADGEIMLYSSHPTIQVGSLDSSIELGNSFDSRSGILDEPADSPSFDSPSGLVATNESLSMKDFALHSGDNRLSVLQTNSTTSLHPMDEDLRHGEQGSIAGSDDFNVAVEFAKNAEGKGYLFKMTVTPKPGIQFRRITQNIFFLIDRSHSIPKERFELTKQAVSEALPLLSPDDTFNILVFDKNVVRFSAANIKITPENIAAARTFLEKQEYGGLFATTDIYSSLGGIVPKAVAENEVNLAILLSDGDTYLKPAKQRTMIKRWSSENNGKVSLYCVASGAGNNIPMLDMISTFNKGSVHIARNDAYLATLIADLMFAIKNPIGKEMAITSVPIDDANAVKLLPANERLPNLYQHIPYVIYGNTELLNDFYLFLQGRYYDKWVNIKRLITFDKAKPILDNSLDKMWAIQQAYESYDRFLADGNGAHLQHARELLAPYKIQTPFH